MKSLGHRLLSFAGLIMLLVSILLFGWEVYGRTVHTPHLWGIFILGVAGAYFMDAPGTSGFITLVLRIVPWGRPPAGTPERRGLSGKTEEQTIQVEIKDK